MANIVAVRLGYSADEAKQLFYTASFDKEMGVLVTPDNPGTGRHVAEDEAAEMFAWDKESLLKLKQQGWDAAIRAQRAGIDKALEYDHLCIAYTPEESRAFRDSLEKLAALQNAVIAATRTENGQKSAFVSVHDDTPSIHVHILMHRFAVDVENKKIAKADDISRHSNAVSFLNHLNKCLEKNGLEKLRDFIINGHGIMQDVAKTDAKAAVDAAIEERGGVAMRTADATLARVAMPTADEMVKLEEDARMQADKAQAEELRLQAELEKIRAQREQAIATAVRAQQAQKAIAERDALQAQLETVTTERDTLREQLATVTTERDTLQSQRDAALQRLDELAAEREQMQAQMQEQAQTIAEQAQTIDEQATELASTQEMLEQAQAEREALREQIAQQQQMLEQAQAERDALQAQVQQLQAQVQQMQAQMQAQAQLLAIAQQMQAQMQALQMQLQEQQMQQQQQAQEQQKKVPEANKVRELIEKIEKHPDFAADADGVRLGYDKSGCTIYASAERDALIVQYPDGREKTYGADNAVQQLRDKVQQQQQRGRGRGQEMELGE